MRIAFLSSTPLNPLEGSGTFAGIDCLGRGLLRLGHRVDIRPVRRRTGFHTLDRWLYNAAVALRPPRDVDLVVGFDLDGFLWARRRRLPFVASLKGIIAQELLNERGWVRALLRLQARWERQNVARADLVVVPSRDSAAVASRLYRVPPQRVAVVPEGIDLEAWRAALDRAPRRPRSNPVVLCVARMYPRKRVGDLLEAALHLGDGIPGARVRIVGRGPEWFAVQARHRALGLQPTVALLGDLPAAALAEEYANADCFCLPSEQEGFGIVFLEAMAAGLPVVACRVSAIPELVLDGVTGVLVPPRDPPRLAAAMAGLLRDPARGRALGEAGRRRVAGFSPEQVGGRFLEAVESVRAP